MKSSVRILLFLLYLPLSSCAQSSVTNESSVKSKTDSLAIHQKAEKLKSLYQLASANKQYEVEFFEAFPDDFEIFVDLYGYKEVDNKLQLSILYDDSFHHIFQLFNNLKNVSDVDYLNKLIKLSYKGYWQSDGVAILQDGLNKKVESNIHLVAELLSKHKNDEVKSFWYFYFDGPHPPDKLPKELEKIKEIDKRVYTLMEEALKEVQQEWEH